MAETTFESGITVKTQGRHWRFEFRQWSKAAKAGADPSRFFSAMRDGKVAWQEWAGSEEPKDLPPGNLFKVGRVKIASKYPVIAIRSSTGTGTSVVTHFYRIVGDTVVFSGKAPAPNSNGPVTYRGRDTEWLFDDYDWHLSHEENYALRYVLYRFDKLGKLYRVRSWKAPKGQTLPDTVGLVF